jgi:DNA polymerase IV
MMRLTPLVEPLSIDETLLDLSGTQELHGAFPAQLLATLARRVEDALAITVSIGLSDNKFLAKLASDLDKPRGFAVLSRSEAAAFLADKPVALLWGVGAAMQRRLAGDGITLIGQLARLGERELAARYGRIGARLASLAHGEDDRIVDAHAPAHSISAENTLAHDEADADALAHALWPLCERVSARLKQGSLAGRTVTLKLKTADFRLRTRSRRLADPTRLAETLFRTAAALLEGEADGVTRFRLIAYRGRSRHPRRLRRGRPASTASSARRLELAMGQIRARLGDQSVRFGCGLPTAGNTSHPTTFRRKEGR